MFDIIQNSHQIKKKSHEECGDEAVVYGYVVYKGNELAYNDTYNFEMLTFLTCKEDTNTNVL